MTHSKKKSESTGASLVKYLQPPNPKDVIMIARGNLSPYPLHSAKSYSPDSRQALKLALKANGLKADDPLYVVPERRGKRNEPRYLVVEGKTRLQLIEELAEEDSSSRFNELPCVVLLVGLPEALRIVEEYNERQFRPAKKLTLCYLLMEALEQQYVKSNGKSLDLGNSTKISIALSVGYKTDNVKSIDRALKALRGIYRELVATSAASSAGDSSSDSAADTAGEKANLNNKPLEVFLTAIEAGQPQELLEFYNSDKSNPYKFEQAFVRRTNASKSKKLVEFNDFGINSELNSIVACVDPVGSEAIAEIQPVLEISPLSFRADFTDLLELIEQVSNQKADAAAAKEKCCRFVEQHSAKADALRSLVKMFGEIFDNQIETADSPSPPNNHSAQQQNTQQRRKSSEKNSQQATLFQSSEEIA